MMPLVQEILAGCIVILFGSLVQMLRTLRADVTKLNTTVTTLKTEVTTMKDFWLRTAERRDEVLKVAKLWHNYALRSAGIKPEDLSIDERRVFGEGERS